MSPSFWRAPTGQQDQAWAVASLQSLCLLSLQDVSSKLWHASTPAQWGLSVHSGCSPHPLVQTPSKPREGLWAEVTGKHLEVRARPSPVRCFKDSLCAQKHSPSLKPPGSREAHQGGEGRRRAGGHQESWKDSADAAARNLGPGSELRWKALGWGPLLPTSCVT